MPCQIKWCLLDSRFPNQTGLLSLLRVYRSYLTNCSVCVQCVYCWSIWTLLVCIVGLQGPINEEESTWMIDEATIQMIHGHRALVAHKNVYQYFYVAHFGGPQGGYTADAPCLFLWCLCLTTFFKFLSRDRKICTTRWYKKWEHLIDVSYLMQLN